MNHERNPRRERHRIHAFHIAEIRFQNVHHHDDNEDHYPDSDHGDVNFDTSIASLHTYLGDVEYTRSRTGFLDGGTIFILPLFCLQGVVLFPWATLPLRVSDPHLVVAIERALTLRDVPCIIGVLRIYKDTANCRMKSATIGTTAEIRQFGRLRDGSLNVITRGQQRFRLRRHWIDVEGVPHGEIQIIEEDQPLRTPRDACDKLAPLSAIGSSYEHKMMDESASSDSDSKSMATSDQEIETLHLRIGNCSIYGKHSTKRAELNKCHKNPYAYPSHKFSRAFCPHWVYQMFDSFWLAQKAADMWKQLIGVPSMDSFIKKPDLLSFYIASKIPLSGSTRQELLNIDGVTYRLRREIELLESIDLIRCKRCLTTIAKRSDMLVMSNEGPLGAYVNPNGYVHEIMTLHKANGSGLIGMPVVEHSWFPGYSWTIAICAECNATIGWFFRALNKHLKPRSFWGIRSCQVAEEMCKNL